MAWIDNFGQMQAYKNTFLCRKDAGSTKSIEIFRFEDQDDYVNEISFTKNR